MFNLEVFQQQKPSPNTWLESDPGQAEKISESHKKVPDPSRSAILMTFVPAYRVVDPKLMDPVFLPGPDPAR